MQTLEQAALDCAKKITQDEIIQQYLQGVFKMGAEWQKEQSKFTDIHTDNSAVIERLQNELDRYRWHDLSVDKDDLPNIGDKNVLVSYENINDDIIFSAAEYTKYGWINCGSKVLKWKYIE